MTKKYILMGGPVRSKSDGDLHHITAQQLCRLYNLNPEECIFADVMRPETYQCYRTEDLIELNPRYDGDYNLLKAREEVSDG